AHDRFDRAVGFQTALGDDLAFLFGDDLPELFLPRGDQLGRLFQNFPAVVTGQPGHDLCAALGRLQRALDVGAVGPRHGLDDRVVVRITNLDRGGLVDPLTGDVHLHGGTSSVATFTSARAFTSASTEPRTECTRI